MTASFSRHKQVGSETSIWSRRKRSAMSWPPSFLTMALSWSAVSPADANVLMIVSPWANLPVSFSSNPRRNHGLCGHSEEWPSFKPLFAMTNRKSYQRTMATIIHLNTIFVNSSPSTIIMRSIFRGKYQKNTFEPPKKPANKGKTPAFADVNPIWLRALHAFRTAIWQIPGNISPFKIVNYWQGYPGAQREVNQRASGKTPSGG